MDKVFGEKRLELILEGGYKIAGNSVKIYPASINYSIKVFERALKKANGRDFDCDACAVYAFDIEKSLSEHPGIVVSLDLYKECGSDEDRGKYLRVVPLKKLEDAEREESSSRYVPSEPLW